MYSTTKGQCGHSYLIGQQSQSSNQNRTQAVIRIWIVNHGVVEVNQVSSLNSCLICRSRKVLEWWTKVSLKSLKIRSPNPSVDSQIWATYRISRGRINITQGFTSSVRLAVGCIGDRFIILMELNLLHAFIWRLSMDLKRTIWVSSWQGMALWWLFLCANLTKHWRPRFKH